MVVFKVKKIFPIGRIIISYGLALKKLIKLFFTTNETMELFLLMSHHFTLLQKLYALVLMHYIRNQDKFVYLLNRKIKTKPTENLKIETRELSSRFLVTKRITNRP